MLLEFENGISCMIYLAIVSALLYAALLFFFRRHLQIPPPSPTWTPRVSILIAMRNEEQRLPGLLASLQHLTYPADKLEIWLLDDDSTDNTPKLAKAFAQQHPHVHYKRITHPYANLQGKMNALAQGIQASSGEIIFITDADCQVPPRWVEATLPYFTNPHVVLVGGANVIQGNSLLVNAQRIDLLFLLGIAAAFANLGLPISILGNNMVFRRSAYHAVGGFEKIGFSITEDAALLQAFRQLPQARIIYSLLPETMVTSLPCPGWKMWFQQRLRWATGGKQVAPWWSWMVLAPGIVPRIFLWLGLLMFPLPWYLGMVAIILAGDFLLLYSLFKQLGIPFRWQEWLVFELFFSLYIPVFTLVTPFMKKAQWKERQFSI